MKIISIIGNALSNDNSFSSLNTLELDTQHHLSKKINMNHLQNIFQRKCSIEILDILGFTAELNFFSA